MLWVWLPVLTVFPASCHLKKKEVQECMCVCVCVCVCPRWRVSFSLVCEFSRVFLGERAEAGCRVEAAGSPVPVACLSTPESAWVPRVPLHFLGSGMILFNYLFGLTLMFLGHYICFLFSLNYISNIYTQWRKLENTEYRKKSHWLLKATLQELFTFARVSCQAFSFTKLGWYLPITLLFSFATPAACSILVPQPGIKPLTLAMAGGFLTTGPPRKSLCSVYMWQILVCSGRFSVSPGGFSTLLQTHPSTFLLSSIWFWLSDPSIKSLFGLYIQIPFCNHLVKPWLQKKKKKSILLLLFHVKRRWRKIRIWADSTRCHSSNMTSL